MQKILLVTFSLLLSIGFAQVSHALTVSPAKIEIAADPGSTVTGEISLYNEQGEAKMFYTSFENFESRGDTGAPYFIGAEEGLATWINADADVVLAAGERSVVPYSITIPDDTKPGGYFAAIFFGTQPPATAGGGEVSVGGKIGILVLLSVSGEIEDKAGINSFTTAGERRMFSSLPVAFEYVFNNTGGDRIVPRGEITIKNTFRVVSETLIANEHKGSVLPNSTRRFTTVWTEDATKEDKGFLGTVVAQLKDFRFGWYTANLSMVYGESAQLVAASYSFFIIPWQLLLLVVLIVAVVWFLFKVWIARLRRQILAEAKRSKR